MNTIEHHVLGRNNNYLFIRFVAASLVIFSHSYHLSGNFNSEPLLRQLQFIDFSAIAVAIFFVASGFLISQSFDSRRNLFAFLEARVLRIFPGLILTVLFTVFIVGAWATTLPLTEYFKNPETMQYVFNNIKLNTQYTLPGVFHNTPFPDGVNGALWTLRLEFYLYLLVAALGMLGFLKSRLLLNLFVPFCFVVFLWKPATLFFIPAEWALPHLKLFGCFVLGLIAYVNRAYIPLNFTVGAGLIALTITGHGTSWFMYSFYISLAYLTLLFAYHPLLRIDQFNRIGDYSYGLYIFGFPVQQSLVYLLGKPDPLFLFGLAFPITLLLAIFSWHLIEKPSLNLKGKLPWHKILKPKRVFRMHQVYKAYPIVTSYAKRLTLLIFALVAIGGAANLAWRRMHQASSSCNTAMGSCNVAASALASPLTGLWWNPNESGWGVSLTQQGSMVFVAWYTYDPTGKPAWYVMSSCPVMGNGCTGDIYSVIGGTPLVMPWNGSGKVVAKVGMGTLTFTDNNNGTFNYSLNGVSGTRQITRQMFATGSAQPAIDYSSLWWSENESGWGVALTQQYGMIFATMYTYDASGNPVWYFASSCPLSGNGCSGDLYQVTGGSAPTVTWNGANKVVTKVGTVSFVFNDSNFGTMSYTINGVNSSKAISRQLF